MNHEQSSRSSEHPLDQFDLVEMGSGEIIAVYGAAESLPAKQAEKLRWQVASALKRLPETDFDRALPIMRGLMNLDDQHCRMALGYGMEPLAVAYAARYGHMVGLYHDWIDLMADPDFRISEAATGSLETLITNGGIARDDISNIVSIMAARLQGDGDQRMFWEDAP